MPTRPYWKSATSTHFLNTSRDGDFTTSLGSLFLLSEKKLFLISNLSLPSTTGGHFLLSQLPGRRGQCPPCYSFLSGSCKEWYGLLLPFFPPDWTTSDPSATPCRTNRHPVIYRRHWRFSVFRCILLAINKSMMMPEKETSHKLNTILIYLPESLNGNLTSLLSVVTNIRNQISFNIWVFFCSFL